MERIKYYYENGKAVIEEKGIKYDYFNPMNDIIFKTILRNDKNHIIIKTLAKEILGLEIKEVLEKDNGFSAKGINRKGESCDYKVIIEGKTISIECNQKRSNILLERNLSHLRRMIVDEGLGREQINIDGYDIEGKKEHIYTYNVTGEDGSEMYKDLLKIIHINISKIKEMLYNEDSFKEFTKVEKVCAIFCTRKREVLEKLMKGDEKLMELKKNIEDIANDEDYYDKYTKTEIYGMIEREEGKEEGREEGREEEKQEIAKKLLKNNVDIEIIISSTGLSKEEIENLKE